MQRTALLIAIAVGVALRLHGLAVHSLWYDECATLHVANSTDLMATLRLDRHPPLSFLLFRGWVAAFGESDTALRLAPALVSCLTLGVFAKLTEVACASWTRVIAVALWSVSPFSIWIGQEVRMYALVEAGAVLALAGTALALARGRSSATIAATFAGSLLACGAHYFGFLVPATVIVLCASAWAHWPERRRAALACGVAAALAAALWVPWLVAMLPAQLDNAWGFNAKLDARSLVELPIRFLVVDASAIPLSWQSLGYLLGMILLLGFSLHVVVTAERRDGKAWFALLTFCLPVALALGVALFGRPSFSPRYLTAAAPGAVLMIANGLGRVPWPRVRTGVAIVALGGCLGLTLLHKQDNRREDFASACAEVAAAWHPGDRVCSVTGTYPGFSQAPLRHYLRDQPSILASIIDTREQIAHFAELPAGAVLHVVYRDAPYSQPLLAEFDGHLTRAHAGSDRFRVQYLRYLR